MSAKAKSPNSSRHSKITGDFGERLVLYWLSRHSYECAFVDHVGIDIIARKKDAKQPIGISVKSRSRLPTKKNSNVNIPLDQIRKLEWACKVFGCKPYFAIVIDRLESVFIFIVQLSQLRKCCKKTQKVRRASKSNLYWSMQPSAVEYYRGLSRTKQLIMIQLNAEENSCW